MTIGGRRVGLLTLPFHVNYGGIVQAAALYQFLTRNGFEVVLLRRASPAKLWKRTAAGILRRVPGQNIGGLRQNELSIARHYPFIRRFIPNSSPRLRSSLEMTGAISKYKLDTVIVGSDQVWRREYVPDTSFLNYFLDFAEGKARRIAYAASFGRSTWPYSEITGNVTRCLSGFEAVSVREKSAVAICRDVLGRKDCEQVLDPTLVVDSRIYTEMAGSARSAGKKVIFQYTLDDRPLVRDISEATIRSLGEGYTLRLATMHDGVATLDVPQWLAAFRDADFVITDSFHGAVFSIIFNRKFIAIGNEKRGLDRFTSVLELLGLSERLIVNNEPLRVERLAAEPIDYEPVMLRLEDLRKQSANFLLSALQ